MLNMNSEKPALLESLGGVQFETHRETLMLMLEKIKWWNFKIKRYLLLIQIPGADLPTRLHLCGVSQVCVLGSCQIKDRWGTLQLTSSVFMPGTQIQRSVELSSDDHLRWVGSNHWVKTQPSCGVRVKWALFQNILKLLFFVRPSALKLFQGKFWTYS